MVKVFQKDNTFSAPMGSYFDGHVKIPGNFIVQPRTHFWGRLVVEGRLDLGMQSVVGEDVQCDSAAVGSFSWVKGTLNSVGDVLVCDNAHLHDIVAGGSVTLRPGARVGDVTAGDTITIVGKIKSGKLIGKNVKVYGTEGRIEPE
jgi:cytoskeletal protein CcmA (bactofilin family)